MRFCSGIDFSGLWHHFGLFPKGQNRPGKMARLRLFFFSFIALESLDPGVFLFSIFPHFERCVLPV